MSERKYFGTDGMRGQANLDPMTAQTALRLGMAAGRQFIRGNHRHTVVIGKDTRLSGYLLEPALTAGFISVGMDVILVGPLPTPAIALSLSRLNQWLPRCQADPEVMQGTADFHHDITDALPPQADPVFDDATALDAAVDMLDPQPAGVECLVGSLLRR